MARIRLIDLFIIFDGCPPFTKCSRHIYMREKGVNLVTVTGYLRL